MKKEFVKKCFWCNAIQKNNATPECSAPDGDGHLWQLVGLREYLSKSGKTRQQLLKAGIEIDTRDSSIVV